MRGFLLAILVALAAPAAAHAEGTDTFTGQGSWFKASNWSLGARPTKLNRVVVPAGHEATITKFGAESNSLTVVGKVAGIYTLTVHNSLLVEPGGVLEADGGINMDGYGSINVGDQHPYWLYLKGVHWLTAAITVEATFWMEPGASFYSEGYEVVVPGETYMGDEGVLNMGGSTWRTGSWFIYPPPEDHLEVQQGTLIVDRPAGLGTLNNTIFSGVGQAYGNLTLEGAEPRTRGSFSARRLTLNRSVGGVAVEAGTTVEAAAIASDGTAVEPARVVSTEPGVPYTIRIPHDLTVEGCVSFSDARVEGGVLTQGC